MLAPTSTRRPSRVTAGAPLAPSTAAVSSRRASWRRRNPAWSAGPGSGVTRPSSASTSRGVPSGMASTASPSPTTAGMPRALARIALWEVGAPPAVQMARTRAGSRPAVSAGVRSRATRTPGAARAGAAGASWPRSRAATCPATASTSSARTRR